MQHPITANTVLICDRCGQRIDDLYLGMIFWAARSHAGDRRVTLAHKQCQPNGGADECSRELFWGAFEPLDNLAGLSIDYDGWSARDLARLILIFWAVDRIATADTVSDAKKVADVFGR